MITILAVLALLVLILRPGAILFVLLIIGLYAVDDEKTATTEPPPVTVTR